jgi:hypothetical protein
MNPVPHALSPNAPCERFKKNLPIYNVITSFLFVIFILCLAFGLVQ